jgi:hypothetical protein
MKENKTLEYTFEEEQLHSIRMQDEDYRRRLKQSHTLGFQEGISKAIEVVKGVFEGPNWNPAYKFASDCILEALSSLLEKEDSK